MNFNKEQRFEGKLIWGVVLINALFAVLAVAFLVHSRAHYQANLTATGHNLVQLLEQRIADKARLIDDAVVRVGRELNRQLATGTIDEARLTHLLASEHEQLPEIDAIRVSNSAGDVLWGKGVIPGKTMNYADRDFFDRHRQNPGRELIITEPLLGRVSGRWILAFTRSYHTPDGTFAGIITAAVPVETFGRLLATVDLGRTETVVLRYANRALIARVPAIEGPVGQPGNRKSSDDLARVLASGLPTAQYHTAQTPDSIERTYSFRRVEGHPFTLAVGLVDDQHLAPWKTQALWVGALLVMMFLVTSAFTARAVRHLRERTALEKAHIEDTIRRRILIEQSRDGIVVLDHQGKVWEANQAFAEMLGYSSEEVQQLHVWDWDTNWTREQLLEAILHLGPGGDFFETRHCRKDGTVYEVEISTNGADFAGCKMVFCVCRDISARKSAEAENIKLQGQLLQAQKMEAIGTLAGGIAHDFNNILGAIIGYTEIAVDCIPAKSLASQYLEKVMAASYRASGLVKQILTFSRQTVTERISLQPAIIIKEALKILRPSLPSTITIKQQIGPTRSILADPTQVHQILMNLCTNAFHAMEQSGGTLEISLRNCEFSPDDLVNHPGVQPGNFVVLVVGDSGVGITPEILARIFDPFFTTKVVGKGTGMGLAITHGIVTGYGGFITCSSQPGKGSVFQIFLPAHEEEAEPVAAPALPLETGRERILLVDDEDLLADLGKVMLERLGYEVTIRTSSQEAWSTFANQPDRFDAVITDQTMPGLTGSELALKMLRIRPDLPIILCTGYSAIISEEQVKAWGIRGFIMKPMTKKEIATLLRQVLDDKPQGNNRSDSSPSS